MAIKTKNKLTAFVAGLALATGLGVAPVVLAASPASAAPVAAAESGGGYRTIPPYNCRTYQQTQNGTGYMVYTTRCNPNSFPITVYIPRFV